MSVREVYRDDWLLIVDKPSGLPSQPDRDGTPDLYTLQNAQDAYVGLHHRLDRPASGLVLLSLDPEVNGALADAFRTHAIQRTYAAVLAGDQLTPGDHVTWDAPLDAKPAVSHVHILGKGNGMRAARLSLQTGRTHQLRRHAALAAAPIVGDRRHGGEAGTWWPRLALHAMRLQLTHPATGEALDVHAPIPADLAQLWKLAGGPVDDNP